MIQALDRARFDEGPGRPAGKLGGLQALRFCAAALVLLHHALEEAQAIDGFRPPHALVLFGASGVDIFFVISGFVMAWSTDGFSPRHGAREFMLRRLARVMPLYWACLFLIVAIAASGLAYRGRPLDPQALISSVLLLPPGDSGLIMGVAWTLVYEMYFYALCALLLAIGAPRGRLLLLGLLLLAVPLALEALSLARVSAFYASPIVLEFLMGAALAFAMQSAAGRALGQWVSRHVGLVAGLAWALLAATTAALADGSASGGLPAGQRWWAWGLPGLVLVLAAVHRPPGGAGRWRRWLEGQGEASYALYLTHGFIMMALAKLFLRLPGLSPVQTALVVGAGCAAAITLASLVHRHAERPLLARLNQGLAPILKRLRQAAHPNPGSTST